MRKCEISIIIPSFHSYELDSICIRSFEKFKPEWIIAKYIVIENSDDRSYYEKIKSLSNKVLWVNNPTKLIGSEANAEAIQKGLDFVDTEFVFFCHCDVCVTSLKFFDDVMGMMENNYMVGTVLDNTRIKAFHISGIMMRNETILKNIDYFPKYKDSVQYLDVGDSLTQYCRNNNLLHHCYSNTFNGAEYTKNDRYFKFNVDRCIGSDGDIIYMHLGRGIPKTRNQYKNQNRIMLPEWKELCEEILR